jgi:hypothetical protein
MTGFSYELGLTKSTFNFETAALLMKDLKIN